MVLVHESKIALRPYKLKELAALYEVDYRTLKKWMKKFAHQIGERQGNYYSIQQVKVIFTRLQLPSQVIEGNAEQDGMTVCLEPTVKQAVIIPMYTLTTAA